MMRLVRSVRCLAVWLGTTSTLLSVGAIALSNLTHAADALPAGDFREELAGQTFDTLLIWLCSAAALGCCVWLWLATTVVIANAALGSARSLACGCPEVLRRILMLACGAVVASSLAAPAQATGPVATSSADGLASTVGLISTSSDTEEPTDSGPTRARTKLSGLPLPDRVEDTPGARSHIPIIASAGQVVPPTHPMSTLTRDTVTVAPGDTLWDIAAGTLGPPTSNSAIARRCEQLHRINRGVIGENPDLIFPGQILRLGPVGVRSGEE
jgi:LysM repeat protein